MKHTKLLPLAIAAVLTLSSACSATRTHESLGENIDDAAMTAKVKSALVGDAATEARNIDVESRRGAVQLNGFVVTEHGRTEATRVARGVAGVKSVKNNLELKETRTAGTVMEDGMLSTNVKLALADSPATKAHEIEVVTNDGRVQLGGWVDSEASRVEAGRLARAVEGVKDVDNNIAVKK